MDSLPRIAPPPFPVQFKPETSTLPPTNSKAPLTSWPTEHSPPQQHHRTTDQVEWALKTDREVYITALESKLQQLHTTVPPASTSKQDSGYASSSRDQFQPSPTPDQDGDDVIGDDDAAYGIEPAAEETRDTNEGDGLLWGFKQDISSSSGDDAAQINHRQPPNEVDEQLAASSSIQAFVTPPTNWDPAFPSSPRADDDDEREPEALQFRAPSQLVDSRSRRISFNSSVRISGGIGGKKSRRALASEFFAPSPPSAPPSTFNPNSAIEKTQTRSSTPLSPRP
ncbi:hypothetical protein P7C70_g9135, partial [Phenoliferia sp. Uapishka_3]